jgi:hypothetical protein
MPRTAAPKAMPQRVVRQTGGQRLVARDYVHLPIEDPVECISIRSRRFGHGGIMRAGSDKELFRKCR